MNHLLHYHIVKILTHLLKIEMPGSNIEALEVAGIEGIAVEVDFEKIAAKIGIEV